MSVGVGAEAGGIGSADAGVSVGTGGKSSGATVGASASVGGVDVDAGASASTGGGSTSAGAGVSASVGGGDVDAGASLGAGGSSTSAGTGASASVGGASADAVSGSSNSAGASSGPGISSRDGASSSTGTSSSASAQDAADGNSSSSTGGRGGIFGNLFGSADDAETSVATILSHPKSLKMVRRPRHSIVLPRSIRPTGGRRDIVAAPPFDSIPGTPRPVVRACRDAIRFAAMQFGMTSVEAISAGALFQRKGAFIAPIEVRIRYKTQRGIEIKQARVKCHLDTAGQVVSVT